MDSPHKGPVTRKSFPFDDVIMAIRRYKTPWTTKKNVVHVGIVLLKIISVWFSTSYHIRHNPMKNPWCWRMVSNILRHNDLTPAFESSMLRYLLVYIVFWKGERWHLTKPCSAFMVMTIGTSDWKFPKAEGLWVLWHALFPHGVLMSPIFVMS